MRKKSGYITVWFKRRNTSETFIKCIDKEMEFHTLESHFLKLKYMDDKTKYLFELALEWLPSLFHQYPLWFCFGLWQCKVFPFWPNATKEKCA